MSHSSHPLENGRSNAITNLLGRSKPVTGLLASGAPDAGVLYALDDDRKRRSANARGTLWHISKLPNKSTRRLTAGVSNRAKGWFHQVKALVHKHNFSSAHCGVRLN